MSYWAVAQTIADRELLAGHQLARNGYEILAPRAKLAIDGKTKIAALFPGYLFVRIVNDQWTAARWCQGVLNLIMAGDHPAHCPTNEIEKIMRARGTRRTCAIATQSRRTALHQAQRCASSPDRFTGLNAIYRGMSARERTMVLLNLLGRQVPVELARDDRIEIG